MGAQKLGQPVPESNLVAESEQRIITADAAVDSFVVQVPVLAGEGDFGISVARDVEDSGRELFAPFGCGLNDPGDADFVQALPGVREENDRDFFGLGGGGRSFQSVRLSPLPEHQAAYGCGGAGQEDTATNVCGAFAVEIGVEHSSLLLSCVEIRELLAKVLDFGSIVVHDVGLAGMQGSVVLVIGFGWVEGLQWHHLGHQWTGKDPGLVELGDVSLGNAPLFIVGVEN